MKGFKLLSWMTCAPDRLNKQGTLTPNETENREKTQVAESNEVVSNSPHVTDSPCYLEITFSEVGTSVFS